MKRMHVTRLGIAKRANVAICGFALAVLAGPRMAAATPPIQQIVSEGLQAISANPTQSAVGFVIGQICPTPGAITDADLQARCNEVAGAGVFSMDPAAEQDARDALQAMGDDEVAMIGTQQVDARSEQIDAIGQRAASVRGGTGAAGSVVYRQANGFHYSGGAAGDGASTPWGFFVNGLYATSDRDTTAREAGFESDDYGVTAGVDYTFQDKVLLGVAFGYKDSDADIDDNGGKLDTESYSVFGYWSLFPDENWFVDAMVGYTDNDHDQERNIIYAIPSGAGVTSVNNTAVSDTDSEEWSFSLAAGRNYALGRWAVTPLVRFEYADVEIDGFTEQMALPAAAGSGLALQIDKQDFESMTLAAGGTVATEVATGWGAIFPQLTFEYVHEFKNNNEPTRGRFVGDSTGTTIVLLTDQPDRNYFNIGAGVSAAMADNMLGFFRYQGLLGYKHLDVHAFEVGLRMSF